MTRSSSARRPLRAVVVGALVLGAWADDMLSTVGFADCTANTSISVQKIDIKYNNNIKTVTFDVSGTSGKQQNVTAHLSVTAYGETVYENSFDPCDQGTFVQQLCPVPVGSFAASGTQKIPAKFTDMIPAMAFHVPDIAALAKLTLQSKNSNDQVACVESQVSNGKTASVSAVSYFAVGVAGAALVLTGVSAVGAAVSGASASAGGVSAGGTGTPSPSFSEVVGYMQGMAMNGMLSVNYPHVYRSFTKNFGFSLGVVEWTALQQSIDSFRASTGGNLTGNSVAFLHNATLVFPDGSTENLAANHSSASHTKRSLQHFGSLFTRQITTSINATDKDAASAPTHHSVQVTVQGIQAYVNKLSIPSANTFMTVLLIVAIVIATIAVGILLVKLILELWALFGSFPKSLTGFRKHYWGSIARAITSLIMLLYGVWVLYCIFQFTAGDSWAAKSLAGVTLALFTAVLAFFSYKIWSTARKLRQAEGDTRALYENKDLWVKYSLFYESYRKDYWWIFVPTIVYMFAKSCALAASDGHGLAQTIAQLIIESLMFVMLLWSRPYERKSSNVINICIQTVRVLSVVCILVFVEELGIKQTTQTVTGVVLIAIQSALTGILAILIAWNAIVACCKANPHRKRRKEMEKMRLEADGLTPLDSRSSMFKLQREKTGPSEVSALTHVQVDGEPARPVSPPSRDAPLERYHDNPPAARKSYAKSYRLTPALTTHQPSVSRENLVLHAAPIDSRQPTLPDVGGGTLNAYWSTATPTPGHGALQFARY